MRNPILGVVTSVIAFTLMLFLVVPGAMDRPIKTLVYGLAWGVAVTAGCYFFMLAVEWIVRLSQRMDKR